MEDNKDIKFIARHYKKGLFDVKPALKRIRPVPVRWWTRTRIAAACAAAVVMTATAALFVHNSYFSEPTEQPMQSSPLPAAETVRIIDFEDAPLPVVVKKIREVYGVKVRNIPENAEDYHLSLHYEGSAIDLVETINEILDTDMTIEK